MRVRCPHCRQPVEITPAVTFEQIRCAACENSFNLLGGNTTAAVRSLRARQIGHFELIREIGAGRFGIVWLARDLELKRQVAVKISRNDRIGPEEAELFFRDARAAAQLHHPNLVSVHEVGRVDDSLFIVSDYIEGANLGEWLSAHKLTIRESVRLMAIVADAIEHAHQKGVIHRDLKPPNILMDVDGNPHIADFGLAKRTDGEVTVTLDGQILGTPSYMSPEQAGGHGHTCDARSDVYSLGCILYELVTGELPFRGDLNMLIMQIQRDEPQRPRRLNHHIDRDLETIILKCLEKDPNRRYSSAADLAVDLNAWLEDRPIRARAISSLGRTWRWCKRHRVVASSLASIFLILFAASVVTTSFAVIAERDRRSADRSRREAERSRQDAIRSANLAINAEKLSEQRRQEAEEASRQAAARELDAQRARRKSERALDFLVATLQPLDPIGLPGYSGASPFQVGEPVEIPQLIGQATLLARREFANDPDIQASILSELGTIYVSLAEFGKAESLFRDALRLHHQNGQASPEALADVFFRLACLLWYTGDFEPAQVLMRDSYRRHVELYGEQDTRTCTVQLLLAFTHALNAEALDPDTSRLVELAKKGFESEFAENDPRRLWVEFLEYFVRIRNGDALSALAFVTSFRRRVELFDGDPRPFQVALTWFDGLIAYITKRYDKAIEKFDEGIAFFEKEGYGYHPAAIQMRLLRGRSLEQTGKIDEAERVLRETLDLCERHYRTCGYHLLVSREVARFSQHLSAEVRSREHASSRLVHFRAASRQSRLFAADVLYGHASAPFKLKVRSDSKIVLPQIPLTEGTSIEVSCTPDASCARAKRSVLLELQNVALGTQEGRYFAELSRDEKHAHTATSFTPVVAGKRVHLLLERRDGSVALYVNGVPQAESPRFKIDDDAKIIGAVKSKHRAVGFSGSLEAIRISHDWPNESYVLPPQTWQVAPNTIALYQPDAKNPTALQDATSNHPQAELRSNAWPAPQPRRAGPKRTTKSRAVRTTHENE